MRITTQRLNQLGFRYKILYPLIIIRNIFLVLIFPFLKWDEGFKFTWYDELPLGWQKAFGLQLLKDLKKVLKQENYLRYYKIYQIKEKFGTLRWYDNGIDKTNLILSKYENLSSTVCIACGEPAEYMTDGWIQYVCAKHYAKNKT